MLLTIISANLLVSCLSLIGAVTLAIKAEKLNRILLYLVSLSAGVLIGGAFLHLLPEAIAESQPSLVLNWVILAFIIFFFIEKVLHWHHCHRGDCTAHTIGYMNLIADGLHNFIDGLIIAAAFMTDFRLGLLATLAVALHEIPQEIGDFGVLLYSGFSKGKAVLFNLLTALLAVAGGVIGYFLIHALDEIRLIMLPLAAGGFIYIAASDLMPEVRKETDFTRSLISFIVFLLGIAFMVWVKNLGVE